MIRSHHQGRSYLIDLLRFFAASWVALYHFNEMVPYQSNIYRAFLKLGYLGVPIFFVISGYCVYQAGENARTAKDFAIRRFFRIFPPYWFSLLLVCVVVLIYKGILGANSLTVLPKSFASIAATVALFTVPLSNVQVINWVYWTLTFELFFYLIIFINLIFPESKRIYWLMSISVLTLLLPVRNEWPFFFTRHWSEFALGMVIYRYLNKPQQEAPQNIIFLGCTLTGLFSIPNLPYYPFATIATATLICLDRFYPLKKNLLSDLGDYAYGIYLIHVPIGIYSVGKIKQTYLLNSGAVLNLCYDLLLLSGIILLSSYVYRFVELPAIKWGKRQIKTVSRTSRTDQPPPREL